jgi:hypothetical protein
LEKNAKKRPANFDMAKAIKKKKPKATNTANATALFTEEQMSVMMKKVMASMKEKFGDQKNQSIRCIMKVVAIAIMIVINIVAIS